MDWCDEFLKKQIEQSLLRNLWRIERNKKNNSSDKSPTSGNGKIILDNHEFIDFSSNDYLGLAQHSYLIEESQRIAAEYGVSSSASRLMSGDLKIHHLLEEVIADFKGKESAIVFGSGYLANIGVIPAICERGDVIFSDRLNHTSIMDGILLSSARFFRFKHNDIDHLEKLLKQERPKFRRSLIIVEGIYSMDGDQPPLKEIVALKEQNNSILMVDEAHATGIFGEKGSGVVEEQGLIDEVDLIMGTFGKALGSYGAYVAASKKMILYLINKAKSFIYSTALPPPVIGANLAGIELIKREPDRRKILLEQTGYFRELLLENGIAIRGTAQIVPVIIGENHRAVVVAKGLQQEGIFALPIRHPTVPKKEARIRFSITYHHSKQILLDVVEVIKKCLKE